MVRLRRSARRLRRLGILAAIAIGAGGAASCSATGTSSGYSASATPKLVETSSRHLPAGWVHYSYGPLSVGAPLTWKASVERHANADCQPGHNDTVTARVVDNRVASTCPTWTEDALPDTVLIECLQGPQSHLYYDDSPNAPVVRDGLHHLGAGPSQKLYLQTPTAEAVVAVTQSRRSPGLANRILSTVNRTGRTC